MLTDNSVFCVSPVLYTPNLAWSSFFLMWGIWTFVLILKDAFTLNITDHRVLFLVMYYIELRVILL